MAKYMVVVEVDEDKLDDHFEIEEQVEYFSDSLPYGVKAYVEGFYE